MRAAFASLGDGGRDMPADIIPLNMINGNHIKSGIA
jgi:hypothetical protein